MAFSLPRYSLRDAIQPPGWISMARLPLAFAFPWVVDRPMWALLILGAAGLSDVLDGWYARTFQKQSETGAALDAVMDKVFVLAVVVSLMAHGSLTVTAALLLGTRDIGEFALTGWAAIRHRSPVAPLHANMAGKVATLLQFAAIVAILLAAPYTGAWIVAAGVAGAVAAITYGLRERPPAN
jgi:cardiolipin synthase